MTLYTIANKSVDGCSLSPNVIADKYGNLWGTTFSNPLVLPLLTKAGELVVPMSSGGAIDITSSIQGGVVGVNAGTGADTMLGNAFAVYAKRKGPDTPTAPRKPTTRRATAPVPAPTV